MTYHEQIKLMTTPCKAIPGMYGEVGWGTSAAGIRVPPDQLGKTLSEIADDRSVYDIDLIEYGERVGGAWISRRRNGWALVNLWNDGDEEEYTTDAKTDKDIINVLPMYWKEIILSS